MAECGLKTPSTTPEHESVLGSRPIKLPIKKHKGAQSAIRNKTAFSGSNFLSGYQEAGFVNPRSEVRNPQ